jgi:alginate O-acetyltransferase complex protein AlgI
MLFNSLEFLIFFPIVVAFYYLLPHRFRWVLLLIASYYFYMCWNYKYVVLLLFTTIICYSCAIWIHRSDNKPLRMSLLVFTVFVYLGTLVFFKYFNFFGESINLAFKKFNVFYQLPLYNYLLPVGISFYTFQALSYTIDVYRNEIKPEYHFGKFALFKSFFPQLVAGPIERASHLLPQFSEKHEFDYARIRDGIALMVWGYFKKVVIADRLSEYVNMVYNHPHNYQGLHFLFATLFFTIQIYCDFSGYSDIARGTARIMGFELMVNFRMPYLSKSIREFWQRWHISLSTWFRDYFYISMGGNRVPKWRMYMNLFLTFLISGLWHGANWTFILWGALHGFYMVFAMWTRKLRERFNELTGITKFPFAFNLVQTIITCALAIFAWIFFRANNVGDAFYIIRGMGNLAPVAQLNLFTYPADFVISILLIIILFVVDILEEKITFSETILRNYPVYLKWSLLVGVVLSIFILGKWEDIDFLYFQF